MAYGSKDPPHHNNSHAHSTRISKYLPGFFEKRALINHIKIFLMKVLEPCVARVPDSIINREAVRSPFPSSCLSCPPPPHGRPRRGSPPHRGIRNDATAPCPFPLVRGSEGEPKFKIQG